MDPFGDVAQTNAEALEPPLRSDCTGGHVVFDRELEQPMSGKARAFPIEISAVQDRGVGTVRMEAKLRAAMFVKAADAMKEMCGILSQLKGGRAGLVAAAAGGTPALAVSAAPTVFSTLV